MARNILRFVMGMTFFLSVSASMKPLLAQRVLFGVKAGVPTLDPFVSTSSSTNTYTFDTKRYTVGPFAQLNLPWSLAVEVDGLYKPLHYEANPFLFSTLHATTEARSWELPMILKRTFSVHGIDVFGGGGFSLRHASGESTFSNTLLQSINPPFELQETWSPGAVVSGGVELRFKALRFQPEVRYTRWGTRNFVSSNGLFASNQNSLDLLIGVAFGKW